MGAAGHPRPNAIESPVIVTGAGPASLPVVATRVGGIPELVEDGVTGLLVPPRDPEALAEAITALLQDRERAEAMGRAGTGREILQRGEDGATDGSPLRRADHGEDGERVGKWQVSK